MPHQDVTLTAGSRLAILIRPKEDGVVVPIPEGSTCAAAMQLANGTGDIIDLQPVIENDEIRIDYDTINVPPNRYLLDIRITVLEGYDQWSEKLHVNITKGIASPSAR